MLGIASLGEVALAEFPSAAGPGAITMIMAVTEGHDIFAGVLAVSGSSSPFAPSDSIVAARVSIHITRY